MRAAGVLIYAPVNLVIQFKQWLAACSAPSHYRNQCWFIVNWNHICINFSQISMLSGKCRSLCSSLGMSNSGNSIWPNPCEHTILDQVRNDIGLMLPASRLFRPSYGTLWHLFITSQRPSTSVLPVVLHVQMGKTATEQCYVYFAKGALTHWGLLTHICARDVGHHRLCLLNSSDTHQKYVSPSDSLGK